MLITSDQVFIHMIGDYATQSSWMANNKTLSIWPCLCHVILYSLGFLCLTRDPLSLFLIGVTHLIIDHWRLARYLCYAKNYLAPKKYWPPNWESCKQTGYNPDTPPWLATWLMIILDNLMHIGINALILKYLGA